MRPNMQSFLLFVLIKLFCKAILKQFFYYYSSNVFELKTEDSNKDIICPKQLVSRVVSLIRNT